MKLKRRDMSASNPQKPIHRVSPGEAPTLRDMSAGNSLLAFGPPQQTKSESRTKNSRFFRERSHQPIENKVHEKSLMTNEAK
jgi:hypothetical protein